MNSEEIHHANFWMANYCDTIKMISTLLAYFCEKITVVLSEF